MSIVVKKFGGSSVANIERIEFVADKIFTFYQKNPQIVVVVSAMKGETDKLENLAYQISDNPDEREMAALLATGEQVVISLLAMALIKRGCPACSYTGLQLGIETKGMPNKSQVNKINTQNIYKALQENKVVIVAGFQGVDSNNGDITTLGRGGSDLTAVALAIALNAKQCDIYTDVDGVYTADPNVVPNAKRLEQVTFNEMLELSGLGAKVMQIKAVELGSYYNMPIKVLSSFNQQDLDGTLISNFSNMDPSIDIKANYKFENINSINERDHKNHNSLDVINHQHNYVNLNYNQVAKIASVNNQIKVCLINIKYKDLELLLNKFLEYELEIDMLTNFSNFNKSNSNSYNLGNNINGYDQNNQNNNNQSRKNNQLLNSYSQEELNVSFVIGYKNLKLCQSILKNLGILTENIAYMQIAKLSIVGISLSSNPIIFSKIYSSLNLVSIRVIQIIASETKVSVLLNEIDLELAIKTLHKLFLIETTTTNMLSI